MVWAKPMTSPNGRLTVTADGSEWLLSFDSKAVMHITLDKAANKVKPSKARLITADYTMLTGKRLHCVNSANEYRLGTTVLRLYNDGVALRYENVDADKTEPTAFRLADGTKRWLLKWTARLAASRRVCWSGIPLLSTITWDPAASFTWSHRASGGALRVSRSFCSLFLPT